MLLTGYPSVERCVSSQEASEEKVGRRRRSGIGFFLEGIELEDGPSVHTLFLFSHEYVDWVFTCHLCSGAFSGQKARDSRMLHLTRLILVN